MTCFTYNKWNTLGLDRYAGFHESSSARSAMQNLLCKICDTWSTTQYYMQDYAQRLVAIFSGMSLESGQIKGLCIDSASAWNIIVMLIL